MKKISNLSRKIYDQKDSYAYLKQSKKGLSKELIEKISAEKNEPKWMLENRLRALELFNEIPLPSFGPDLSHLDFAELIYYASLGFNTFSSWKEVPDEIKNTFERLKIPEAERKYLAGVGAQYESDVIYHRLKDHWEKAGVIFEDMDNALKKYPELVKKYFMQCVPITDHKFAALHYAVWSGGTFLYIPRGIKVSEPLQAYFRMNAPRMGQFEHTLIIVEEESSAHYIEGCSAPKYGKQALHAGCVEIFVKKSAHFRYSSVENWSKDTFNLNTKRAIIEENGKIEWVGGNFGSNITMLYPCSILRGKSSKAHHLGIAFAGKGQTQDTGAKVIHLGEKSSSEIIMKSLSKDGGKSIYRGLVSVAKKAKNCLSKTQCDALILDENSSSDTIPKIKAENSEVTVVHEASAGKLSSEDIFYLMSRGLSEEMASAMIINGFIDPVIKELPLEYAVEMNRLIELEMENAIA